MFCCEVVQGTAYTWPIVSTQFAWAITSTCVNPILLWFFKFPYHLYPKLELELFLQILNSNNQV